MIQQILTANVARQPVLQTILALSVGLVIAWGARTLWTGILVKRPNWTYLVSVSVVTVGYSVAFIALAIQR